MLGSPTRVIVLVLLLGVVAAASATAAKPVVYGVKETKACFTRAGATFGSPADNAYLVLPSPDRPKLLVMTVQSPAGLLSVHLVIGRSAADARAVRARLVANGFARGVGAHTQGEAGNAAWLVTVVAPGSAAPKRANETIERCLRAGSAAPAPSAYRRDDVLACLMTKGAMELQYERLIDQVFGPIPPAVRRESTIVDYVPNPNVRAAAVLVLFFGKDGASAVAARTRFQKAVGRLDPVILGSKRNLAWYVTGKNDATARAGVAALRHCL